MATLVLKKKPAFTPELETVKTPLQLQVDLVGSQMAEAAKIAKQIKDLEAKLKPLKLEVEKLQQMVDELELGDDDNDIIAGDRFRVEIGPRGNSRSIKNIELVRDLLGDELFLQLARVTLKDCDNYLTLPQREQVIETSRTRRSMKVEKA